MNLFEQLEMSTPSQRLKEARINAGLTQKQVADAVGMTQPSYNYLEKKDNSGSAKLTEIARVLKVDPYWLRTGKTSTDTDAAVKEILDKASRVTVSSDDNNEDKIWVDLVNIRFSCGDGESIEFHFDDIIGKREIPAHVFKRHNCKPENTVLATAIGDSQEPYVCNGDEFAIDISNTSIRDGEFYAVYFEGEAMLKQIFKEDGGKLILHSLNPKYKDKEITDLNGSSFRVIGWQFYRAG